MAVKMMGAQVKRKEDPRLITGASMYTGDISLPGLHYVAFVRSPHAHARIRRIDAAAVLKRPGVVAVVTGADLKPHCGPVPVDQASTEGGMGEASIGRKHYPLAIDRVRHVGEAVAAVIAATEALAVDAAADVVVDWEPLPAVSGPLEARKPGAPQIHADAPATWSTRTASRPAIRTAPSPRPSRWSASGWSASASAASRWRGAPRWPPPIRPPAGAESGVLLVVTQCEGAVRQFLVPTDAPGVRHRAAAVDRPCEGIFACAVRRRRGRRIRGGRIGRADRGADRPAEPDRADAAVRRGRGHPRHGGGLHHPMGIDRHSFGRPIGSYQALKHKYADLKIWFEACRATTNAAVAEVASRSPGADMAVSVAKSYVGEHAPGMLQDCIQLHGGIGVTWEHDLHLFLRRVTLYRSMFGTPEEHNLRVYALTEKLEHA